MLCNVLDMLGKNRLCIKVSICVLYFLTSKKQQYLLKISKILTFGSIKKNSDPL